MTYTHYRLISSQKTREKPGNMGKERRHKHSNSFGGVNISSNSFLYPTPDSHSKKENAKASFSGANQNMSPHSSKIFRSKFI